MRFRSESFSLFEYPFPYAIANADIPCSYEELLAAIEHEPDFNKNVSTTDNFQKTEIRRSNSDGIITDMLEGLSSYELTSVLARLFQIGTLYPDTTFDGGGLTITETGGHLRYHADFPYSNSAKKYRVINCLLYLSSPDIEGGNLHLLDPKSRTVEASIAPLWGTILAFPTAKNTPHGFSKVKKGRRISVNAYFYSDRPLDDRFVPGKTEWI